MQIHITLVMIMFILVVTAYVKPFGGEQSQPLLLLELGSLGVTFLALWSGSIFNDYPKCQDPLQGEGITLPWCDALSLIVGVLIILYIIVVIVYFVRFKCQCGTQEISTDNPLQDINLVIIADGGGEGGGEGGGGGGSTQGEDSYSTSRTPHTSRTAEIELTPIASGRRNPTLDSSSRGQQHCGPGFKTNAGMQLAPPKPTKLKEEQEEEEQEEEEQEEEEQEEEEETKIAKHTTAPDASTYVNDEWMMYVDEQTYGPYLIEDLQLWLKDKSIEPDAFVNNGGEWIAVSDAVEQFSGNNET